ncbi:MAG: hypothetical protein V4732_15255 [Pseudomonadota bacterium]
MKKISVLIFLLFFSSLTLSDDLFDTFNIQIPDRNLSTVAPSKPKVDRLVTKTSEEILRDRCAPENISTRKSEFTNLFKLKNYKDANKTLQSLYNECSTYIYEGKYKNVKQAELYYWFIADLTISSYKVADTNFCLALGLYETAERNIPFEEVKESNAFKAVIYNIELCKKKRESQISTNFVVERCSSINSGFITSKAWNSENAEYCVDLYTGNNGQDISDKEGNKYTKEDYPYLKLLIKENGKIENRKLFFTSGIFSEESYCFTGNLDNVEFLTVGGTDNNMLLRIKSYFSFCWPGSASLVTDSVYRIDLKKGLVPVNELTIALH